MEQPTEPTQQRISFEDFLKLDIRIGKITNIEDIANADKLYKITISLGTSERTVAAGLKNYYTKEQLLGKKVAILTNLERRTIRGVVSDGMLLAADDGKNVKLLTVDDEVSLGSKVR